MPTLNWIGKDAIIKHHLEVPFHLLKDVPDLACGDPGGGKVKLDTKSERTSAFKQWLLPESSLVVAESKAINFATMSYEPGWNHEGGFQFKKHNFGPKPGELKEKRADDRLTEEFQCAQYLDAHTGVKFWARNLSRRTTSFRLQTATDWFYPDFICLLNDGSVLAVEYKGTVETFQSARLVHARFQV